MSDFISKAGKASTEMTYTDRSRSRLLPMVYAEKLFDTLTDRNGDTGGEVVEMFRDLSTTILEVAPADISELWTKVERNINSRKPLSTKATTDESKALTLLSLFYEGANLIDIEQLSTADLSSLRDIFTTTQTYMQTKFRPIMSSKDQRVFDNITTTIENRIADIAERFNTLVEEGAILGGYI